MAITLLTSLQQKQVWGARSGLNAHSVTQHEGSLKLISSGVGVSDAVRVQSLHRSYGSVNVCELE